MEGETEGVALKEGVLVEESEAVAVGVIVGLWVPMRRAKQLPLV
jgi:hypothetical protein